MIFTLILYLSQFKLFSEKKNNSRLTDLSLEELMNIKVTVGVRGDARKIMDSLVPVRVINSDEIESSGYISTGETIQSLLPSFYYYRTSVTDGTDHIAPATLKGMGTDQLLVLINGKRWQRSALLNLNGTIGKGNNSIDFDSIPLSAIDRIEVLSDGASAQYGSDAIAGIINIVLKENFISNVETFYSQTSKNDGKTKSYNVNLHFSKKKKFKLNIISEYKDKGYTNRAEPYPRQQYYDGDPRNGDPEILNRIKFRYGDAESKDFNFIYNSEFFMSEKINFYSFGLISSRKGESAGFFRRPLDIRNVISIYPDGFLPLINPICTKNAIIVGIKSKDLNGWNADVAVSYSTNSFDFYVKNSLNASFGDQSPKEFYCGSQKLSEFAFNTDLFKSINIGSFYPLDIGFGVEFRKEKYSIIEGEEASYKNGGVPILTGPNAGGLAPVGAQVYPGYSPENALNAERDSLACYLDIENSINDKIRLGVAARYENYSDFGTTYNGKISARIQLLKNLSFRSTIGTGFRAPSLAQSHFTATSTVGLENVLYDVGTFSVNHPLSKSLGAIDLKPEKSKNFSFDLFFQVSKKFNIQFGYFLIDLKDKILITDDFLQKPDEFGTEIPLILDSFNVAGARFFTNAIDMRTDGIDMSIRYQINLSYKYLLQFSLIHHYNTSRIVNSVRIPDSLKKHNISIIGEDDISRLTEAQPNHVTHFNMKFLFPRLSILFKMIRYGDFYGDLISENKKNYFGSKVLMNIDLKYKLNSNLILQAGCKNIFNVYPDRQEPIGLIPSVFPYANYSPFGFRGTTYYLKLKFFL